MSQVELYEGELNSQKLEVERYIIDVNNTKLCARSLVNDIAALDEHKKLTLESDDIDIDLIRRAIQILSIKERELLEKFYGIDEDQNNEVLAENRVKELSKEKRSALRKLSKWSAVNPLFSEKKSAEIVRRYLIEKDIVNLNIEYLGLSRQSWGGLKRFGINTVDDLFHEDPERLLEVSRLGTEGLVTLLRFVTVLDSLGWVDVMKTVMCRTEYRRKEFFDVYNNILQKPQFEMTVFEYLKTRIEAV